jgi:hypothetical protein
VRSPQDRAERIIGNHTRPRPTVKTAPKVRTTGTTFVPC